MTKQIPVNKGKNTWQKQQTNRNQPTNQPTKKNHIQKKKTPAKTTPTLYSNQATNFNKQYLYLYFPRKLLNCNLNQGLPELQPEALKKYSCLPTSTQQLVERNRQIGQRQNVIASHWLAIDTSRARKYR